MKEGTVVSIGTFDGVHVGHQAILRELRRQASQHGLPSVAYAFSVPPRWVLRSGEDRYLLLPAATKLELLSRSVDRVIPVAFEDVQAMTPESFVREILVARLKARVVVEGEPFHFGCGRSGDIETLRHLGDHAGFELVSVPPVMIDAEPVSSTRIREAIESSDFDTARRCLGRAPVLSGEVVHGVQVGDQLGYPTANLHVDPHVLLPRAGVFLVHALGRDIRAVGLLYIGTRPTFHGSNLRCEVHLLDFPSRSLYGESLEIHLLERIRGDQKFPSMEALRSQIASDIERARCHATDYPYVERHLAG